MNCSGPKFKRLIFIVEKFRKSGIISVFLLKGKKYQNTRIPETSP